MLFYKKKVKSYNYLAVTSMNNAISSDSFLFWEITRDVYHHSDNHIGAPWHYLAYMLKGRCRIVSNRHTIDVTEGDVFYIPMNLPYQSYWYGDPEIRFLSFAFRLFPEAENDAYCLQTIPCDSPIKDAIRGIPTGPTLSSEALGQFYSVLTGLLPLMKHETRVKTDVLLLRAQQHLREHPDSTVRDIARHLDIGESTVYTLFKNGLGKTPNTVRQELLCEKAVFLLTTTDLSVQEISDTLGFSSTSYFRKTLRRHTGQSPRELRKSAHGM